MTRRYEYTGETSDCGHRMYYRVVNVGSGPEAWRGPSCWHNECERHRRRQASWANGKAAT